MSKRIIAVDPGSKGFFCVWDTQTDKRRYVSIADCNKAEIAAFLRDCASDAPCVAVMEEVHAIFGSSARATFSFGEIFGFLQGLFVAYNIPYILVPPKEWQKEIWTNYDKVFKSGKTIDTKKTSIMAAMRLFPDIDFRRTQSCKVIDDNKVDATLIAEYARRKNL